jgi:hypothetical protein
MEKDIKVNSKKRKFWIVVSSIFAVLIVFIVAFIAKGGFNMIKLKQADPIPVVSVSWNHFADSYIGMNVAYASDWQVVRTSDGKTIKLYPPNKQQVLTISLGKNESEAVSDAGNFRTEKAGRDGKATILDQEASREVVVIGGKIVEVYWAKKPLKIAEGKYLSATLSSVPGNAVIREVDLKPLDIYQISEQTLASLEIN